MMRQDHRAALATIRASNPASRLALARNTDRIVRVLVACLLAAALISIAISIALAS